MLRENSIFRKVNTKNEYVYVVEILKDSKEVKISPTSNEKEIETISISDFKKQYQKCFATLEENEIYIGIFSSENRDYISIGNNIPQLAKSLLKKFNSFCYEEKYTFSKLAKDEDELSFFFYKMPINDIFTFETEYWNDLKLEKFIGNYLNKFRKNEDKFSAFMKENDVWN